MSRLPSSLHSGAGYLAPQSGTSSIPHFAGHSLEPCFSEEEDDKKIMAKKMRAVQVPKPKGPFEIVERDIPEPQAGWVRVKVDACGICHSDSLVKEGLWPGIQYPRVPGHEVIGIIDVVGSGVPEWKTGQRVGIGWHGGNCGHCDPCRRGNFFA